LAIIIIGHLVTIPTALAIAEIATNQKVEGGGEYFIISRSFGLVIGSSIGIALYFSQAISVAFYIIAFAEASSSLFEFIKNTYQNLPEWLVWLLDRKQTVSIPALFILMGIVLIKGADLGVKALYAVVFILFISLLSFFIGQTAYSKTHSFDPTLHIGNMESTQDSNQSVLNIDSVSTIQQAEPETGRERNRPEDSFPISFFVVFAIIFPAFTGMTAGVGLSGDLEKPSRSIPLGTIAATICGMVMYVLIAVKLTASASPVDLAGTSRMVMADIAWQGWLLIPIGLAAATISSALGSILVAPRTLQAIARDKILPSGVRGLNYWLSKGRGKNDEPFNATLITIAIAFIFVMMGELDFVAQIISMFFMVTYGSLCLISFLQHFAADPAYRPTFKSKWYFSLFGAMACFGLMFFMNPFYAFLALVLMVIFYLFVSYSNADKSNLAVIFQGVIFQISRSLQIFLQKAEKEQVISWRPSVVCISESSFERFAAFDLLRWISQKYGFGTYIHKISGYLSKSTNIEAKKAQERLIKMAETSKSKIYIDTLISPSFTSAIAQVIQLPGISGTENNLLMFEFSKQNPDQNLENIIDDFNLIKSVDFDVIVLGSSERGFGFQKEIHIWITSKDYNNATLMILLGYIILGHRDWHRSFIKIFAVFPEDTYEEERKLLYELIEDGQLPIAKQNIKFIPRKADTKLRTIISEKSRDADMTIIGFRGETVKHEGAAVFKGYEDIGNTVFVNAAQQKIIK
jgi:amino acid transporter